MSCATDTTGNLRLCDGGGLKTADLIADGSNKNDRTKRKDRSIARLSPTQLARKRENDREAQRTKRQRIRKYIEVLELQVRDLTLGKHSDKALDELQQRNYELQTELRLLKESIALPGDGTMSANFAYPPRKYLFTVIAPSHWTSNPFSFLQMGFSFTFRSAVKDSFSYVCQLSLSSSEGNYQRHLWYAWNVTDCSDATQARNRWTALNDLPSIATTLFNSRNSGIDPARSTDTSTPLSSSDIAWSPRVYNSSISRSSISDTSSVCSFSTAFGELDASDVALPTMSTAIERVKTNTGCPSQNIGQSSSVPGPESENPFSPSSTPIDPLQPSPLLAGIGSSAWTDRSLLAQSMLEFDMSLPSPIQPSLQAWAVPLRFVQPTRPFDSILIGLVQLQKRQAINGAEETLVTGPYQPSMKTILYPDQPNQSHPVSSVISGLLNHIALRTLPEKAAILFIMYRLVQWQISPSPATYGGLPGWQTPRVTQLITPHPVWVTNIIWGKLRDKVIENQDAYATDEFQHLYMRSLNINWPYRDLDVFRFEGDEVFITDAFERHVRTLQNWSLDSSFAIRYPMLRDDCRFT